ncbi:MAG: transglutaminase-like domain-containing protein, partial [Oscillospiraceae bacterium]|nr:transglutaminase-like domain-containing protein [Oscillospiraceae bacterium]
RITSSFSVDGLSPLLRDSNNLKYTRAEMPQYSFSVKNISANTNYLYMPYNLVPESVSRYRIDSGSSFGGADKSYIGQFYDPKNYYGYQNIFRKKWSTPAALSGDEAVYRSFVYANYLDIPESFSPEEIFDESYYQYITAEEVKTGKSTLDEMTVLNRKIYFIRKWLRDNCEYSLSAGKLPAGRDFVDHFLENREGSCSHFASAAVIMCRYAGIPARYAEGYVIKPADFPSGTALGTAATVSVSDLRGHAWAEIYLDGFGWYPVEFTSGYGNIRTSIPTETPVSEPETESETVSESESEPGADTDGAENASSEYSESQDSEQISESGADTPQQTTAPLNAETEVSSESEGLAADIDEAVQPAENKSENPTVGFGIFGLKGGEKVDVLYDLTWLVVLAAVTVIVPMAFILRRNAAKAKRRRTALH